MIRTSLIALLFWPVSLVAQPLEIRSGEHETFSRLVIEIPVDRAWQVTPTDGGAQLEIADNTDGFELSGVFDRIPRDRLNDIRNDDGVLSLAFDCTCYVDSFLWRPDRLVLDLVDGIDPDASLATSDEDLESIPVTDLPDGTLAPQAFPDLFDLTLNRPDTAPSLEQFEFPADAPLMAARSDNSELEQALIEGIARAASQGYLDPSVDLAPLSPPAEEQASVAQAPQPPPIDTVPPELQNQPGIGVSTALDQSLMIVADALNTSTQGNCISPDLVNFRAWGDDTALHDQAAPIIATMNGDFGQENASTHVELAKLYLHFGFGAEAQQILSLSDEHSNERQILFELADLVDETGVATPILSAQAGCETPAAFWAMLAAPRAMSAEARNTVLQAYFDLPHPLRGQLAPRVSDAFLEIGDEEAAEQVLNGVARLDVAQTHPARVTEAEIALATDDLERAREVLAQEAEDNARTTPISVIRLIDLTISSGLEPSEADLLLAGALEREYRTDPVANELALAQARGWRARGEYETALGHIDGRQDDMAVQERNAVYQEMTEKLEDGPFLEVAFSDLPTSLSADLENAVAARLITLGFPQRGLDIMRTTAQRDAAAERRFLRAEAALALQDFSGVLDAIQGITTERAQVLRSQAYEGQGTYDDALSALQTTEGEQSDLQFRAEAWERLADGPDSSLASFATTVLDFSPGSSAETLEDRRVLLDQAAETRRSVEELLNRFPSVSSEN
ncbi:MAG: hypothetical protein AAGL89_05615 [Pseudomonadota bacterium]